MTPAEQWSLEQIEKRRRRALEFRRIVTRSYMEAVLDRAGPHILNGLRATCVRIGVWPRKDDER